jgi:hypothetical protein
MTSPPHLHDDAPLACTLPAGAYARRVRDLSDLAQRALVHREPIAGGERLTFADEPGVERDLAAAVAAETACCAFLTLRLDRHEHDLALTVTGPPAAQHVIAELFA